VIYSGPAQAPAPLSVAKDPKFCGATKPDESLELGPGAGVKNVLLWVLGLPAPAKPPKSRVQVALSGCQFVPHVAFGAVGGELLLVNEDPLFHNVTASGEAAFSYAMPLKGHTIPTRLKKVGLLKLESKSHPWMKAWVQVLPGGPAQLSEADGTFYLDLPPGLHQLKLWHERLGERSEPVEVAAGKTLEHDFTLAGP
jgi:hypothetical protein